MDNIPQTGMDPDTGNQDLKKSILLVLLVCFSMALVGSAVFHVFRGIFARFPVDNF